MKAAGWGLEEIEAERVVLLSFDGELLEGSGRVHVEYPIHAELLRTRPELNAVVHSHAESAVVFASLNTPLAALSHDAIPFCRPDVARFLETGDLIRDARLGGALAEAMGSNPGCLIPGHGFVTAGPTLAAAVMYAALLNRACRLHVQALQAGGPVLTSSAGEIAEKQATLWTDAQLAAGFDYLVRGALSRGLVQTATPSEGAAHHG